MFKYKLIKNNIRTFISSVINYSYMTILYVILERRIIDDDDYDDDTKNIANVHKQTQVCYTNNI